MLIFGARNLHQHHPLINAELKVVTVTEEAKELIVYLKTNFIDRFTTNDDDIDPPPQPQLQDASSIAPVAVEKNKYGS